MVSLKPSVLIFNTFVVFARAMEKISPKVLKNIMYRSSTVQYKDFYTGKWEIMESQL